ncbi:MAG TPA: hypothetical protein VIH86_04390 [Puia sp.]
MSTNAWFAGKPNQDNTSQRESRDYQTPAYASTLSVTVKKNKTLIKVGTLTGNMTINAVLPSPAPDDNPPYIGDSIDFLFSSDGVADHIVTFGTGFKSTGTLTVASGKFGKANAMFDGNEWLLATFPTV